MKTRNKIGIIGWSQGELSFGVSKSYLHYLNFFGDVRILTPKIGIDEDLDLVIMPGGRDTLPTNYGAVPGYFNSDPDMYKEHFAKINLPQYIDAGIPVFGICLGFQQIAVHFGGKLLQNIDLSEHGYSLDDNKEERGKLVNELAFAPDYIILEAQLLAKNKNKKIKTCSLHHQAVSKVDLPEQLDLIAYTKNDNIVEAFKHKTLPISGVQFHPEEDFNLLGRYLIMDLLKRSPNKKYENKGNSAEVQK